MKSNARRQSRIALLILLATFVGSSIGQEPQERSTSIQKPAGPLTPRQIVEKVMPSVVLVVAQDMQGEPLSQGSGFVYKPGLIVTNLHVFKRASNAFVKLVSGGISYKVTGVAAIDIRHDLCVVRIEDKSIPPLTLNGSNKPQIGDEVFAFGNPKGLEGSVSKGIISSIRSDQGLIQIDAAISSGSSGGPVVNDRAEVIGIAVSSLVSGQNLNFSVPSGYLVALKEQVDTPVSTAGALSITDRENENLKGSVKTVTKSYSLIDYDKKLDKYTSRTPQLLEKKVFDEFGALLEDWSYNLYNKDELPSKYFYFYDEKGLMTRYVYESSAGKRESFENTGESPKRRNLSGVVYVPSVKAKTVYDQHGNVTESVNFSTRTTYSYDRNGFNTEVKTYEGEVLKWTYLYSYELDGQGNWVKCTVSRRWPTLGDEPSSTIFRKIIYFGQ